MEEGEERERVVKSLREVREAEKDESKEGGGVRKGRMERERFRRTRPVLWDHVGVCEAAWQESLLAVIL